VASVLVKKRSIISSSSAMVEMWGMMIQANYGGDGHWCWAEVSKVCSNGHCNVFCGEDCEKEITSSARLRWNGTVDEE